MSARADRTVASAVQALFNLTRPSASQV